jgi:hypothetical protein
MNSAAELNRQIFLSRTLAVCRSIYLIGERGQRF